MDKNSFFIKKLSNEIIETVLADEANISYTHIELASRHKWSPGISIHQYVRILKCWKIIRKLQKKISQAELELLIFRTKDFSSFQKKIFRYIIHTWLKTHLIVYSLSDNIENFKLKKKKVVYVLHLNT